MKPIMIWLDTDRPDNDFDDSISLVIVDYLRRCGFDIEDVIPGIFVINDAAGDGVLSAMVSGAHLRVCNLSQEFLRAVDLSEPNSIDTVFDVVVDGFRRIVLRSANIPRVAKAHN